MKSKSLKPNPWPKRLKALRQRHGLTLADMAAKVGVSVATWNNWEYGTRTPTASARALLDRIISA